MAQFPKELAPHQIEMLFAGKSVFYADGMKTLKDFTGYEAASADGTLGADLVRIQRRVTELEGLNAELQRQVADAEAGRGLVELVEALIPDSRTGFERLPSDALAKVARYRGVEIEGREKPEIVAALMEKGEA